MLTVIENDKMRAVFKPFTWSTDGIRSPIERGGAIQATTDTALRNIITQLTLTKILTSGADGAFLEIPEVLFPAAIKQLQVLFSSIYSHGKRDNCHLIQISIDYNSCVELYQKVLGQHKFHPVLQKSLCNRKEHPIDKKSSMGFICTFSRIQKRVPFTLERSRIHC